MDTVANLKAFLSVARTRSFAGAARELNVAPSVVTKRINQLERALKAPLFERTTRLVSLSAIGRQQLPAIQRVIADFDGIVNHARASTPALQGQIRIKLPTSLAVLHIGRMLHAFQAAYPRIQLEVMALDRSVNPVDEGFDIALTLMPPTFGGVESVALCAMPRTICASPDYLARRGVPAHPNELAQHDILNFLPSGNSWQFLSKAGELSVTLNPRLNSNEAQLLLGAALAGNGIAVLGRYLAAPALAEGTLRPVLADFPMADLWMKALVPESRMQVARVRTLLEWLQRELSTPPWEPGA
uniref:LysR family transcriptional regulator n=1 Tax=unclassified Variovorax TaxID=663243 RepID=UPI000D368405